MKSRASPVKELARRHGIEILQPSRASEPALSDRLEAVAADVAIVVAYGKLLPATLLDLPRLGFINLHFSLLPAYRGAAPVQRALMDDLDVTGVSVIRLTEGMDEGPILASSSEPVRVDDSAGTLGARLAELGAPLLIRAAEDLVAGTASFTEQDNELATYAPKVTKPEARIDWSAPPKRISALVRALDPAPGAWTDLEGRRLKVFSIEPASDGDPLAPGEVSAHGSLRAGTGDGVVSLTDVQFEGKRRMDGADLARGLRVAPGTHFG
jgi:methionyl-tRNA formyltransferase